MSHVHGISVDPESSRILLATHDGLDDATDDPAVKISDSTIDLMGFTATAEPNVFYASGNPGPGSSLPNPSDSYDPTMPERPGSRSPGPASPTSTHWPSVATQ